MFNNYRELLETHVLSHEKSERKLATCCCEICGKFFANQLRLELHFRTHTGYRPEVCHICSKTFTQPGGLIAHKKTHLADAKNFCCDVCGKKFLRKEDLKHHFRLHTGGIIIFKCSIK